MSLFLQLLALVLLLIYIAISIASMIKGAVFIPTNKSLVKKVILLGQLKRGKKSLDLGSGDGRVVIALAKAGVISHGYEINPLLVWWSRRNIKKARLEKKAFIHWGSFWNANFSEFDFIFVFGIFYIMKDLEKKLKKELKKGTIVISSVFQFPNWKYIKKDGALFLYQKK